jgi:hypothetical protein
MNLTNTFVKIICIVNGLFDTISLSRLFERPAVMLSGPSSISLTQREINCSSSFIEGANTADVMPSYKYC